MSIAKILGTSIANVSSLASVNLAGATEYAHYKCNDDAANTTVTDDGTGSNNGTASTNTNNLSATGKINDAFDFNGSSEYIDIDALQQDIESDTTGTISAWIYINTDAFNSMIFSLGDTNSDTYFMLRYLSNDNIQAILRAPDSTYWSIVTTSAPISKNTWHHIVIVQDAVEPKLYLDGEDITEFSDTSSKTSWFSSISELDNGRLAVVVENFFTGYYLDGKLDDFRYYQNIALSLSQVKALYNNGNGREDAIPAVSKILGVTK